MMEDDSVVNISSSGLKDLLGSEDGKNFYWADNLNVEMPIKVRKSGCGAVPPITVPALFRQQVQKSSDRVALFIQRNNVVYKWTWKEYQSNVDSFAKSMYALGIDERKCVNIMGHNSPEWAIAYLGSLTYNCTASGIYTTNNPEACFYQADHSEAQLVVVDSIA